MLMVMSTRETGRMTRLMASEDTFTLMVPSTRESGRKTSNMVTVRRAGPMVLSTRVNTSKVKKMAMEGLCGQTDPIMRVHS